MNRGIELIMVLVLAGTAGCIDQWGRDCQADADCGPTYTCGADGVCEVVDWVTIPGGSFQMGSNDGDDDETPVHPVTVPTFQLAKTEVTVAQYALCVAAGACSEPGAFGDCNWGMSARDRHPVNCVSGSQARAFSEWAGGRLPSEAEWEYAARSGGKDHAYPWGDATPSCDRAVYFDCGFVVARGVCSKPSGSSAQGLCDLAGNVWELVEDAYHESYSGAPDDGSAWTRTGGGFGLLFRGGSLYSSAGGVRAANREWFLADLFRPHARGFRPARSLNP